MSDVAASLRGDHVVAARGQITLDREKAREKLQRFRLPNPHFYVLQFVRAATVLGADRIEFAISASEMTCTFDREIDARLLEDIWGVAFEERTDAQTRAVHCLALGIGSAQALNPAVIRVDSADVCLTLRPEEEVLGTREAPPGGTVIRLKERLRFGHLVEFFATLGGEHAETAALRSHCELAEIEVVVNGRPVGRDLLAAGKFGERFTMGEVRGAMALDTIAMDGSVALLHENVHVRQVFVENHGLAAMGAVTGARLNTDLSGLNVIEDAAFRAVYRTVVIGKYHAAMLRWLTSGDADEAEKLGAAAEVTEYVSELNRDGVEVPSETSELASWLLSQPLFESATDPASRLSVRAAQLGSAMVRVSSKRFDLVDAGPVLLVEPTVGMGIDGLKERLVRAAFVAALRNSPFVRVLNVGGALELRQQAARNEAMWRAQPTRRFPQYRFQRTASVDGALGNVYLPLGEAGAKPDEKALGVFIFIESKLLRHQLGKERFGVGLDGAFEPDSSYSDVKRDEVFDRLAIELCAESLGLYQDFADALISQGAAEAQRPRLLDEVVYSLCRGDYCSNFLLALGYAPERIEQLLTEHAERLRELTAFVEFPVWEDFVERLGAIAHVRSYELADGSTASLAELIARDPVMLLRPARDFLATARADVGREVWASIVLVDAMQEWILKRVRPNCLDARLEIPRLQLEAKYLAEPEFDNRAPTRPVAAERETARDGFQLHVMLIPDGERNTCETLFIWRKRLLARRRLPVPLGSFRVVVTSEELRPTDDYLDVAEGPRLKSILDVVETETASLLDSWWNAQRKDVSALGFDASYGLFFEVSMEVAAKHPDLEVLPVMRWSDGDWIREQVSQHELQSSVERGGRVLAYTHGRGGRADLLPRPDTLVVPIATPVVLSSCPSATFGMGGVPRELRQLFGPQTQIVDISGESPAGTDARESFRRKPEQETRVAGGVVEWSGRVLGLEAHAALFADPGRGTGRQSNIVSVLYEGRLLEKIDVVVPMGQFRTVFEGDAIAPDPAYRFAASGRAEVLDAAQEVSAKLIREACRLASQRGGCVGGLEHVREDLLRFLAVCHESDPPAPFDLVPTLQATPLFLTTSGHWLSIQQLAGIATDQIVPYSNRGARDDVLLVLPFERALHARVLEGWYELRDAMQLGLPLVEKEPQSATDDSGSTEPLLRSISALLVKARGERRDLLDDHMMGSFRWGEPGDGRLCKVSSAGVEIDAHHPLVRGVKQCADHRAHMFVASAIYSAINAHYREITDHDELELQRRLLSVSP